MARATPASRCRSAASPPPSPQQPRPTTSLQFWWLRKSKIDQRATELALQIGQISLGEAGQVNS
jgi:hypothetical protein